MAGIYCFNMGGNEVLTNAGHLHTTDALAPGQRERERWGEKRWGGGRTQGDVVG